MRKRLTALLLTAALAALMFLPAAGADEAPGPSINGTLTFDTFATENGIVRGVFANFDLVDFTAIDIDDSTPGGIVVRLLDTSTEPRTISLVTLRAGALHDPGVPAAASKLTAPIDSVWGSFDYAADGYWTQPRNLRINGGNCDRIGSAAVTVQLTENRPEVTATIAGPPGRSCDDIRR